MTQDFDMDETQTDDSGAATEGAGAGDAGDRYADTRAEDGGARGAGAGQDEDGDGEAGDGEATPTIDGLVAQWRTELDGQTSIPATDVQDRLLDLWGALPENQARAEVERWLTETLARHLYRVDDITSRLDTVLSGR